MDKRQLFDALGLQELFDLPEFHSESPEVVRVCRNAIAHTIQIWGCLKMTVRCDASRIKLINKLARCYGREPLKLRRLKTGPSRGYVWGWAESSSEVEAA